MSDQDRLAQLNPAQRVAVDPAAHIWLNASAGTGKTQVLSARVLRLLLQGVSPDAILCITFTKAGAAEMAHRIHERLALWVRCSDGELNTDLQAIGLAYDAETRALARTLFARVIDSPAGAIRVQTIHSFCQSLLASFPFEAQVLPGFRLIEGGEAKAERLAVLGDMLTDADEGARRRGWLGQLSRRLGEQAAVAFVEAAARKFADRPDPRLAPPASEVRAALGLPTGDVGQWVEVQLAGGAVADADVRHLARSAAAWSAKTGQNIAAVCDKWLTVDVATRITLLPELLGCVFGKTTGSRLAHYEKQLADAADAAAAIGETCSMLLAIPAQAALADDLAAGWQLAAQFATEWQHHKLAEALAEYEDLIARTAQLLANGDLSDWIRFKLDQRIDHVLIDEAQDTNADQWKIAKGLTEEFFAGEGTRDAGRVPSMFTVGDRKQAIFSFQGTDPVAFETARQAFAARAEAAVRPFVPADLVSNFRSAPAVLAFVDRWLADGGVAAMGIDPPVPAHHAFHGNNRPGRVELWPPLIVPPKTRGSSDGQDGDDGDDESAGDDSLRAATDPASLKLARALADRISAWIDGGIDDVAVRPDDVLVLVRSRKALAARIVAQLQSRGVPVAGVDRFDLANPLAVQDLLAALRFIVQPDDEYSLAVLLVSPLIGWTQQQLYDETAARGRTPLRQWIAGQGTAACLHANARLEQLRGSAEFTTPYRLLDAILSGPMQGRKAMAARLGAEANDAIDALLAEALAFETRSIPSIIGFLDHIDRAPLEVKRQMDARGGLVRVMTVHGAKGLQAPIVILADATSDPTKQDPPVTVDIAGWRGLPIFRTAKDVRPPLLDAAHAAARAAQLAEHWRLFYVAATRAERLLVITGTLPDPEKLSEASWFRAAQAALQAANAEPVELAWETPLGLRLSSAAGMWTRKPFKESEAAAAAKVSFPLPGWAMRPAPEEARPPKPLAPSHLGADDAPQRPAGAERAAAIRRGILLHSLIERLPGVAAGRRMAAAQQWLDINAPEVGVPDRAKMADEACKVLNHPDWAALFGPGSLAEAPFSAVIDGGIVVAGTVDRLLVTDDAVLVVDYKTGAHVPADARDVARAYLRQMAAYTAALTVIFPGRRVEAALLYSAEPRLVPLPADLLAAHKPGLEGVKANLPGAGLEPDCATL